MKLVEKLKQMLQGKPHTAEEVLEAERVRNELEAQSSAHRAAAGDAGGYGPFGGPGT